VDESAGDETPAEETPTDETAGDETPTDETEETPDEDAAAKSDPKKIEANLRKHIAEIKKTDPAAAKLLQSAYFEGKAYKEVFPTVAEAKTIKQTYDNLGGAKGISDLKAEVGDYRNEIEQFANGDEALLKDLHTSNPTSFIKMTENALNLLKTTNPAQFRDALIPSLAGIMEDWGFNANILKLADLVKAGNGQGAYDLIREMAGELANLQNAAGERAKAPKADPKADAITKREAEITRREQETYRGDVNRVLNERNNPVLQKLVEPVIKSLKLQDEGRRDFVNSLNSKIWAAMKADAEFQTAAKDLMEKGDANAAAIFIADKFKELAPGIFIKHRNALYPNFKAAAKSAAPKVGQKAVQGKVYRRADVDVRATPDVFLIAGKAFLKGTRTVVKFDQSS
jgi:hypothetical protein